MKLASYTVGATSTFGVVTGDGVIDAARCLGGRFSTLRQALAADALDDVRRATVGQAPDHKLTDVKFLPVVPDPQRIVCIGINSEELDFFTLRAPDRMSQGARSMTGLYVRRQSDIPVQEATARQDMLV